MAGRSATLSRNMFNESLRYSKRIAQMGPPKRLAVDADWNDFQDILATQLQRTLYQVFGEGSPNNGFKIIERVAGTVNNFTVVGGGGTGDTAGSLYVGGIRAQLFDDVDFISAGAVPDDIHYQSTTLTDTVLTSTEINLVVNELVGQDLIPNAADGTGFPITANTANTITCGAGGLLAIAAVGDYWYVAPSTPAAGARTDIVFLDVFKDEFDEAEDTSLVHTIDGQPIVSMLAEKIRNVVFVREDSVALPTSPWTDPDGNIHWYYKLAELARLNGNVDITTAMITDYRVDISRLPTSTTNLDVGGGYGDVVDGGLTIDAQGDLSTDGTGIFDKKFYIGGDTLEVNYDAALVTEPAYIYMSNSGLPDAPKIEWYASPDLFWFNYAIEVTAPATKIAGIWANQNVAAVRAVIGILHNDGVNESAHQFFSGDLYGREHNECVLQITEDLGAFVNDPRFTVYSPAGQVILDIAGSYTQSGPSMELNDDAVALNEDCEIVFANSGLANYPFIKYDGGNTRFEINKFVRITDGGLDDAELTTYPSIDFKSKLTMHARSADAGNAGDAYYQINIGDTGGGLGEYTNTVYNILKLEVGTFIGHHDEFVFKTIDIAGLDKTNTTFSFYGNLRASGVTHALHSDGVGIADDCFLYFSGKDVANSPYVKFEGNTQFEVNFPFRVKHGNSTDSKLFLEAATDNEAKMVLDMENSNAVTHGAVDWQFRCNASDAEDAFIEADYQAGAWGIGRPRLVIQNVAVGGGSEADKFLLEVGGDIKARGDEIRINSDGLHTLENSSLVFATGVGAPKILWNFTAARFEINNPVNISSILNLTPIAGDPGAPVDGDLWINSVTSKVRARIGGVSVDVGP